MTATGILTLWNNCRPGFESEYENERHPYRPDPHRLPTAVRIAPRGTGVMNRNRQTAATTKRLVINCYTA